MRDKCNKRGYIDGEEKRSEMHLWPRQESRVEADCQTARREKDLK